jgi:hypothetical protein
MALLLFLCAQRTEGGILQPPHFELEGRGLARYPVGFGLAVSAVSGFVPV